MIRAIAIHTFREAVRKKIPHLLIGLGALIFAVSPVIYIANEPDAQLKLMLGVFFQAEVLLCVIGMILLSATSLPLDIENKTIYGVLSKPISKLQLIMGKIVGFALLSALILSVLSLFSFAGISWAAADLPTGHKEILRTRKQFNPSEFCIKGKVHHESGGIQWIKGGRTGVAAWSFTNLCNKPDQASPYEAELHCKMESNRGIVDTIPIAVNIEDASSGLRRTNVLSARMDKSLTIKLAPGIVKKDNTIRIAVFPVLNTDYIGTTQEGMKVFLIQKGFFFNYAKGCVLTFFKFMLIISIAVMCSVYLSAPVSIASALMVFLCGHLLDFIKDVSALISNMHVHEHTSPAVLNKPNGIIIYLDYILKKPLEWFANILPDFKKFDCLQYLLKGINIPKETILFTLGYTAIYVSASVFISYIILKKREYP